MKAGLYIIATPIGNLGDITLRALETLKSCDLIACEDTRVSRKLFSAYGIDKSLISYRDHNGDRMRPIILAKIASGQAVALVSDAGTPLISDPGYKLVRACCEAHLPVAFLPGPCAVIAGLVLSGMPCDRFLFAGFADKKAYPELSALNMTLIFFESPRRLTATLKAMAEAFPNRTVAVVREITKFFEAVQRGSFQDVRQFYDENGPPKGEAVVALSPPGDRAKNSETEIRNMEELLRQALKTHSIRDACALVAGALGLPRKQIYERALAMRKDSLKT